MKRQSILRASGAPENENRDPASILATMNDLCTPEGLSELIELARSGRLDRGMDGCFGITWTNVAHRALELIAWVLSEFGHSLPSGDLDRIMTLRAVGVNWIHGGDGPSPTGEGLSNCGIFEFDTSRLRRAAWELLKQDRDGNGHAAAALPITALDASPDAEQASLPVYAVSRAVSQLRPIAHVMRPSEPNLGGPRDNGGQAPAGNVDVGAQALRALGEGQPAGRGGVAMALPAAQAGVGDLGVSVASPKAEPADKPGDGGDAEALECAGGHKTVECAAVRGAERGEPADAWPAEAAAAGGATGQDAAKRVGAAVADGAQQGELVLADTADRVGAVEAQGADRRGLVVGGLPHQRGADTSGPGRRAMAADPGSARPDHAPSGIAGGEESLNALIEQNQDAIRRYPVAAKPYRALFQLYSRKRHYDAAFCASQVLSYLGMANEAEQRFFETHRPKGLLRVTGKLDQGLWANVVHSDEDGDLSRMFEILVEPALRYRLYRDHEASDFSAGADASSASDQKTDTVLVRMFDWASAVFGIDRPRLLVRDDVVARLVTVPCQEPTSLAGRMALSGMHPRELTFLVGRHLTGHRAAYRAWSLLSDVGAVRALVAGAIHCVDPVTGMALIGEMVGEPRCWEDAASIVGTFLRQSHLQRLAPIVRSYVQAGSVPDIVRWLQSVELTMCRAGLLLSGDLGAASKVLYHPAASTLHTVCEQDKIEDLLVFSVSPEYLEVRKALGVSLELEA